MSLPPKGGGAGPGLREPGLNPGGQRGRHRPSPRPGRDGTHGVGGLKAGGTGSGWPLVLSGCCQADNPDGGGGRQEVAWDKGPGLFV